MNRPFYRLSITVTPAAIAGSLVIGALIFGIVLFWLQLSPLEAVIGALIGVVTHWGLEILHHLGHAWAAQRTGYPMTGIQLGTLGIFGTSLYPSDEPAIPGPLHIRRALGGPILSALIGALLIAVALLLGENTSLLAWWLRLGILESFLMSVGALMPIRFLDGGSILYWRSR